MGMMTKEHYAHSFCKQQGIPTEQFVDEMLRHALYPHARLLLHVLLVIDAWSKNRLLAPDREIIGAVGNARSLRSIATTLSRMHWYYGKRWTFREETRLRISSRRVMKTARATFLPAYACPDPMESRESSAPRRGIKKLFHHARLHDLGKAAGIEARAAYQGAVDVGLG